MELYPMRQKIESMSRLDRRALVLQWIDALRSGHYEQGMSSLCHISPHNKMQLRYCCLGVLSDIIDPDGWTDANGTPLPADRITIQTTNAHWHRRTDNPDSVVMNSIINPLVEVMQHPAEWNKEVRSANRRLTFQYLNDIAKYSFSQIADVIEFVLDDVFPERSIEEVEAEHAAKAGPAHY